MERVSDRALMERIQDGDHDAFRLLLERHWSALLDFASGMVGVPAAAEDIVQETFVQLWKHRAQWSPSGSVRAYLYRITRNLALNLERDREVHDRWREATQPPHRSLSSPYDPESELAAEMLRREVGSAIAGLPQRRREVFILSRFHGLSHREIAEAMGIAPQTVSNQMRMALAHLREVLSRHVEES